MGQTLSHGVYLPNEGERNCYAGLASNWQILNTAVGAIAEKAPLVHTHTVSQITDFPAYGNAAGTICEGNDSRLSDARTPVAHTHTKSDVTDLLNSNFIPSANNSYNLGSSSYQWNNAYIKSLTINGVACGDILTHTASEFVDVTGNQTIGGVKTFSNDIRISKASPFCNIFSSGYIKGQAPTSNIYSGVRFFDDINSGSTNTITGGFELEYNRDGYNKSYISSRNYAGENHKVFTVGLRVPNDDIRSIDFLPSVNGIVNLGTSTNKWKSLNGINPGALSLPNFDSDGYTDLSSDLTENVQYVYTPTVDGWLALFAIVTGFHAENAVGIFNADTTLGNNSFRWAASATAAINLQRQTGIYYGSIILPVKAGYPHLCWLKVNQSTPLRQKWFIFYKAKGNV